MEILSALGVNWTFFAQLVCFAISYFFLTALILKPYGAALRERESRTVGNEELAVRTIEEAHELQATFEQKAKTLNSEIRVHYDKSRSEAMARYDELVQKARGEAGALLKTTQAQIEQEVKKTRAALASEIPAVSASIASKLAGKEISL